MADDKTIRDERDRSKVDVHENYEMAYLEEKFGINRDEVIAAIAAVGNNREKIEEYLRGSK